MEDFVVADDPGRECGEQRQHRDDAGHHPSAPLPVTPVASPCAQERNDGKRDGLGERGEAGKQAEASPVEKPARISSFNAIRKSQQSTSVRRTSSRPNRRRNRFHTVKTPRAIPPTSRPDRQSSGAPAGKPGCRSAPKTDC